MNRKQRRTGRTHGGTSFGPGQSGSPADQLFHLGLAQHDEGRLTEAESIFRRALQLDPNNVDALAAKGWVDMDFGAGFMADDRPVRLASAEASATKALSLAPDHAFAHLVLGSFYSAVNRSDEAIADIRAEDVNNQSGYIVVRKESALEIQPKAAGLLR